MKFSTKQLVLLLAAVLGLFTFACLFMDPVRLDVVGSQTSKVVFFKDDPIWPTMIGYFLALAVGVALVVFTLVIKDKDLGKLVRLICVAVMALVAILCFSTAGFYSNIRNISLDYVQLAVGSILGGISAILTAGLIGVAEFVLKD